MAKMYGLARIGKNAELRYTSGNEPVALENSPKVPEVQAIKGSSFDDMEEDIPF